jgi:hypothetical protein
MFPSGTDLFALSLTAKAVSKMDDLGAFPIFLGAS